MPGLVARFKTDCINEFNAAAEERFQDGQRLALEGRRAGAIYLWGYAAEMNLKSAYFRDKGFPLYQRITIQDLKDAKKDAIALGITWTGMFHDLLAWAETLVARRGYSVNFATELANHSQRLQLLWRETLRYRKNRAHPYELARVRDAVEWLRSNASDL